MSNKQIKQVKFGAVIGYMIIMFAVFRRFSGFHIFDDVRIGTLPIIALHVILTALAIVVLFVMIYVFATNHFARKAIQDKITNTACLKEITTAKLISYKLSNTDYVTLAFRAEGVSKDVWESKRNAIQSAINYTIIGDIEYSKNCWSVVYFNARKGRTKSNQARLVENDV
ncbi:MAG: hypothetical protein FWE06_03730 [Oscillospiraceae bacterium]|nr:hypothetical protein [Oscillospiraceae bacterium]